MTTFILAIQQQGEPKPKFSQIGAFCCAMLAQILQQLNETKLICIFICLMYSSVSCNHRSVRGPIQPICTVGLDRTLA